MSCHFSVPSHYLMHTDWWSNLNIRTTITIDIFKRICKPKCCAGVHRHVEFTMQFLRQGYLQYCRKIVMNETRNYFSINVMNNLTFILHTLSHSVRIYILNNSHMFMDTPIINLRCSSHKSLLTLTLDLTPCGVISFVSSCNCPMNKSIGSPFKYPQFNFE